MQAPTSIVDQAAGATLASPNPWGLRWNAARQIARQELRDALFGWSFYLTASLGALFGALFIYNSLNFVARSGLQILERPFYVPVLLVATMAMLYLIAWATLAIARPRDQGALRVLFFAPVDSYAVVAGHLMAGAVLYALLAAIGGLLLYGLALLTNLPFPAPLLVGLVAIPLAGLAGAALGLFLSALSGTSRTAMLFLGAALLLILAVPAGYSAMLGIPPTNRFYDALLFLRELVRTLRDLLDWISPFALVSTILDATVRSNWGDLARVLLVSLAGAAGWSALAVWGLRRRGVLG